MARDSGNIYAELALFTQLGISMAMPIVLGVIGGNYLDQRFQTGHICLIVGLLFGVAVGFVSVYRLVIPAVKNGGDGKK